MTKQWHGGKGSQRRNTDNKAYADNWEKIFGKDKGLSEREKVLMDPLAASQRSDANKKGQAQQPNLPTKEEIQRQKEQAQDPRNG